MSDAGAHGPTNTWEMGQNGVRVALFGLVCMAVGVFVTLLFYVDDPRVALTSNAVGVHPESVQEQSHTSTDTADHVEARRDAVDLVPVAPLVTTNGGRRFDGPNMLSRVRIAVADAGARDSNAQRAKCLAITASTLFPLSFEHIEGNDDTSHVNAWLQREYCHPFSRYAHPRFVVLIATCVHIRRLLDFVRSVVSSAYRMESLGAAAVGHIWIERAGDGRGGAPHMRPYVVFVDTHKYFELGCPDVGPFNATATARLDQPLPHFVADGSVVTPGTLRRMFVKDSRSTRDWFAVGTPRFMTNFLASALARDLKAVGLPGNMLTNAVAADLAALNASGTVCPLCKRCVASESIDAVFDVLEKELKTGQYPYTAARSAELSSACFDFADTQQECLSLDYESPSYLGTNEGPQVTANLVRWTATLVVPRLVPGTVHFMSVVGGMNGLNVAAGLRPTSITFFDYGATKQICVGRIYLELLKHSNSRADFVTSMFARNFAAFVREDPEGEMTMTSQVRYLQRPVDEAIYARTVLLLSPLAAACYTKYFRRKIHNPLQWRTFTPVYMQHTNWPGAQSGNFTIHYGVPGSYLGSEGAMLALRDCLRRSPIGFADYDFNRFEDLLLHRESQRSDNLVVHISNADDRHYPYIPNIEGLLSDVVVWLRRVPKPAKVFVVSTNGVYMASREGWTFDGQRHG